MPTPTPPLILIGGIWTAPSALGCTAQLPQAHRDCFDAKPMTPSLWLGLKEQFINICETHVLRYLTLSFATSSRVIFPSQIIVVGLSG
jgi:hypothetical protein